MAGNSGHGAGHEVPHSGHLEMVFGDVFAWDVFFILDFFKDVLLELKRRMHMVGLGVCPEASKSGVCGREIVLANEMVRTTRNHDTTKQHQKPAI